MKLVKVFNELCNVTKQATEYIKFNLFNSKKSVYISKEYLNESEYLIGKSKESFRNGILAIIEHEGTFYYIHIKDSNIYVTPYINGKTDKSINVNYENMSNIFEIKKTKFSYKVIDQFSNEYIVGHEIFLMGNDEVDSLKKPEIAKEYIYLKFTYENIVSFLEYTLATTKISFKTSYIELIDPTEQFKILTKSNNTFKLNDESNQIIKINNLLKNKSKEITLKTNIKNFKPIIIKINNRVFLLTHIKNQLVKIKYDTRANLLFNSTFISSKVTRKGIEYTGTIYYKYLSDVKIDNVLTNDGLLMAKIEWLSRNDFKFTITNDNLSKLKELHNNLYFAHGNIIIHSLNIFNHLEIINKVEGIKVYKKIAYVSRISLVNNLVITATPKLPIYNNYNKLKIKIANQMANVINLFKNVNVNLYFEKNASSASESGFAVFESVKKDKEIKSVNKFIVDSNFEGFNRLKDKYKNDLVRRYSFKHYFYLFIADNFISSELSNHVLAIRVYDNLLANKITKTPLYFLQHGIMFAKPVDNPMALGFHKENQTNNLKKNVISSDLEAQEFYKMGYNNNDLMKTGLPKLDQANLNEGASKIAFMPTWRYWEEAYVINNEIEKTSYYKSLIEVIETFEKAGLLDKLLIVPHNKFADYIKQNLKKYKHIINTNPSEALKESKIFITDYSSIIYDAIYRGGYPIFYWKEKDYLIENYKAIPPVNDVNAPGDIAYSEKELIEYVTKAINNNYIVSSDIKEKYLKINEFADNKNTERVINELIKEKVL
ncbi:CDP-glycerol glycerophosphotransferase [Mammaliicoccus sciuri]|uniref:CDP-glycerol glycerophosphotransferase family protein n=1 Tax=Mammaliicoccus sciuri TaxID=1296 RepID=UPI000E699A15|nr:CDP-glycerol glycerophosphotransferase family protein [Mammaliicoccus sciuri]MEB6215814.1 CDP-glycerol glycerophosphotransferase family protein [Mammaliicoccus sciuri]RIO08418.1 CDP-glycerol glycerophosphotransferase [Mammaliicoccus sciuri]